MSTQALKKSKIIFTKTVSNARECFLTGHEYDIDEAEAAKAIRGGVARAVAPVAPAVTPVTTPAPAPIAPVAP